MKSNQLIIKINSKKKYVLFKKKSSSDNKVRKEGYFLARNKIKANNLKSNKVNKSPFLIKFHNRTKCIWDLKNNK